MNQLYIIWNMELILLKLMGLRVQDSENTGAYKGDNKAYNDAFTWV